MSFQDSIVSCSILLLTVVGNRSAREGAPAGAGDEGEFVGFGEAGGVRAEDVEIVAFEWDRGRGAGCPAPLPRSRSSCVHLDSTPDCKHAGARRLRRFPA